MEVQTFFLCNRIDSNNLPDNPFLCHRVGLHSFYPLDGVFPLDFTLKFYLLLRRESKELDEPITLRVNCVDMDGRTVPTPGNLLISGSFPKGKLFWELVGDIKFSIPKEGTYRLDITADEDKIPSVYNYKIEILKFV